MNIKKFNELTEEQLDKIVNRHFSYWSQCSPFMTSGIQRIWKII